MNDFKNFVKEVEHNLTKIELKHISNSGGILNYNDPFSIWRDRAFLFTDIIPTEKKAVKDIGINPVMTLKSKVSFIKDLDKNQSISYGRKYFTKKN